MTTIFDCLCGGTPQNFGEPSCLEALGAPNTLVIAQRKKSDGTDNFINYSVDLTKSIMTDYFYAEDAANRYIIIPNIKNYTPEQAEPVTDEASNGDIDNVRDGVASMTFEFRGNDIYKSVAKWKATNCLDLMVFLIDDKGNLMGKCEENDMFGGLRIAKNSQIVLAQPRNFEQTNKYTVKFNLDLNSGWDKLDYLSFDDFVDFSLLSFEPLRDVNISITGITATTIDFKLFTDWGSVKKRSTKGTYGLTTADLQLYNVDDEAVVSFLTLVEPTTPDGTYSGTFASQDTTETVYVDPILNVKEPLSLNRLPSVTADIP